MFKIVDQSRAPVEARTASAPAVEPAVAFACFETLVVIVAT